MIYFQIQHSDTVPVERLWASSLFVFGSLNAVQMPLNMFYSFWNPSHLIVKARPVSLLYFIYHLRQGGRGGWQGGENSKASVLGGLIFSVLSLGIMHGSWWKRCILVAGVWVSTKWASGGKPSRLLAKWLNCILLVNLPSLSILLEITNMGSRSRSGRRHPPVCKRINSWQIIENYYILTVFPF